jgi:glycerophosphoryl diester phosphodiesterase
MWHRAPRPLAIAHRGGARLRPENTLAAFDHALTLGVDAIECDVRLSGDGEPVLIHDETLDRTTDATGPVAALTAAELARVDAGFRFGEGDGYPFRGRGHGVPRLLELLCRTAPIPVIVEIKGENLGAVGPVLDAIASARAGHRVVVGGFSHAVLTLVRARAPWMPTSASQAEIVSAMRRAMVWLGPRRPAFQLVQAPLRLRGRQVLTRSLVRRLRRSGFPVQAWIVDERRDMHMVLDWGATGLISDRPDRAVDVVRERITTLA